MCATGGRRYQDQEMFHKLYELGHREFQLSSLENPDSWSDCTGIYYRTAWYRVKPESILPPGWSWPSTS